VGGALSATVVGQNLPGPEILRFSVVWLLSFLPLGLAGAGLAVPERLQEVLAEIQRLVLVSYRERVIQHEAGHFLLGYLLGYPVKAYSARGMKSAVEFYPLSDEEVGKRRARDLGFDAPKEDRVAPAPPPREDRPFFSEGGSGEASVRNSVLGKKEGIREKYLELPPENDPKTTWPFRGFDSQTVDKLSVVSIAGVCAEILAYGNAEGGYADLAQLRKIFASCEEEMDEREMENRIRFAIGYGVSQLRLNLGLLDAVVEVMRGGGSVEECYLAIESCDNVRIDEVARRQRLRERMTLLERVLFRGKNGDKEKRVVQGKGGGDLEVDGFQITGDDALYAAIAVAFVFFVWASTGGLSLH